MAPRLASTRECGEECNNVIPPRQQTARAPAHYIPTRSPAKCCGICLRLPLYTPVNHSHLLHQLNLPSLYSRRKIKHILLAHSIYHQYAPPHILQLNLPPLTTPIYSLRCQRSYHIPSSRTDRHKDSPIHKSLHLFNLLPEDIKNTHDRTLFKSQISALLTNSVCSCSHHPLPYSP